VKNRVAQLARSQVLSIYMYLLTLHNYVHFYPTSSKNLSSLYEFNKYSLTGCYDVRSSDDLLSVCAGLIGVVVKVFYFVLVVAYTLFLLAGSG
jgi:hypothetical protein